ncbi:MAG TPA: bifunctional demethylmenaquinone methyltransferase/2-methoxy-6-polyprenyl-1,4-benzoquinol methylase UbiE [Blastocatellia bacterium]|nr:bifunctional demethylmenaquinone methyltransferase/2-methoxy-6-polyprenyl-1,4-benzoquinol methylase UbiE [Blastocatellia bacterium]
MPGLEPGSSDKAARVREMFGEIAPRYDLLNHLLSLNIDKRWRRFVIDKVADRLQSPGSKALDLCCGTAELSLALGALAPTVGVDFCHPMLKLGLAKLHGGALPVELVEADALRCPMSDESFDVVTMAFGLRNLENICDGLREVYRLLKPGGCAAVLEFSHPRIPVFRNLFHFYFTRVLPRIGNAVSGSSFAYRYLPESVLSFPDQNALAAKMRVVGFSSARYYNLAGGIAALHIGDKDVGRQEEPQRQ